MNSNEYMQFSREMILIGEENFKKINDLKVLVLGIGGVGSYTVNALARCGVGTIGIVDNDEVSETNINRQLIATYDTIGRKKVDVMEEIIHSINPKCIVHSYEMFYLEENSKEIDFSKYDFIVDCVDTISAKIEIIKKAKESNVEVISCMGTGNKFDPFAFKIADINQTSMCPLARTMRYELKKREIKNVKVLYSTEKAKDGVIYDETKGKAIPGSIAYIPSVAGLMLASYIINSIINK